MAKVRLPWGRYLWLLLIAVYFLLPLLATGLYSLWAGGNRYNLDNYARILADVRFRESFGLSFGLAIETVLLSLLLVTPAVFWAHLRWPGLRRGLELISALPFVVPPIALVGGLSQLYGGVGWLISTPQFLVLGYVVLALPYTFRTLDVGFQALDLRTLTEAAQSLGAGWGTVFFRVILPNLRGALLGAALLTIAVVMGEFTFANVLLFNTFAVYINYVGQTQGGGAAALSLLSFGITWLAMLGLLSSSQGRTQLGGVR